MLKTGKLIKVGEFAERLSISRATVHTWIKAGKISAFQPGGKRGIMLIEESEIEKILRSNTSIANHQEKT